MGDTANPITNQLAAFKRLQEDAAQLGIRIYPLDGESLYLVARGGFTLCSPNLQAAIVAVRQFGSGRE